MNRLTINIHPYTGRFSHLCGESPYIAVVAEWPETGESEDYTGRSPSEALGQCLLALSCSGSDPLANCSLDITVQETPFPTADQ